VTAVREHADGPSGEAFAWAVPSLFVRGGAADRPAAVGGARLIGLGCGARPRRAALELAALLQIAGTAYAEEGAVPSRAGR
jgi:hypothetical protein